MALPRLKLEEVKESGMVLSWGDFNPSDGASLAVEYKEALNPSWEDCQSVHPEVPGDSSVEIFELEPGRPYMVRVKCGTEKGPECVYDTLPLGCTPKDQPGCGCIVQ
jgi:hypothetical protein